MIELRYVDKRHRQGDSFLYIDELQIQSGEIVGLLGENGSGKTTLFKVMMGLTELNNGTIRIDGQPVHTQYERIAFISEEGSFPTAMTPETYGLFLSDFFPRFDRKAYREMLQSFELPEYRKISTFSKGQRMRLEMSAGLAKRADYLLLDEPFSGEDVFARREGLRMMLAQLQGHETVLLATHHLDDIEHVLDRVLVLHQGILREDMTIDALRESGQDLVAIMEKAKAAGKRRHYQ